MSETAKKTGGMGGGRSGASTMCHAQVWKGSTLGGSRERVRGSVMRMGKRGGLPTLAELESVVYSPIASK